jgi:hypothetical protein
MPTCTPRNVGTRRTRSINLRSYAPARFPVSFGNSARTRWHVCACAAGPADAGGSASNLAAWNWVRKRNADGSWLGRHRLWQSELRQCADQCLQRISHGMRTSGDASAGVGAGFALAPQVADQKGQSGCGHGRTGLDQQAFRVKCCGGVVDRPGDHRRTARQAEQA